MQVVVTYEARLMVTLLKIVLFGVLATISAKIGITVFYDLFSPGNLDQLSQEKAIQAALVGILFASPFLYYMVRSVKPRTKVERVVNILTKVNKENLNETDPFFDGVKELKRKR